MDQMTRHQRLELVAALIGYEVYVSDWGKGTDNPVFLARPYGHRANTDEPWAPDHQLADAMELAHLLGLNLSIREYTTTATDPKTGLYSGITRSKGSPMFAATCGSIFRVAVALAMAKQGMPDPLEREARAICDKHKGARAVAATELARLNCALSWWAGLPKSLKDHMRQAHKLQSAVQVSDFYWEEGPWVNK